MEAGMSTPAAANLDENAAQHACLLFYGELGMCGCGNPEDAYRLIRDILDLTPFYEGDNWQKVNELIGSPTVVHIVVSMLNNADLIEHGTIIDGSWLTKKGKYFRDVLRAVPWEQADSDEIGYPHNGEPCTCWERADG
jgi:hypothetical protein